MPAVASVTTHYPVKFSCNVFIVICFFVFFLGGWQGQGGRLIPPAEFSSYELFLFLPFVLVFYIYLLVCALWSVAHR